MPTCLKLNNKRPQINTVPTFPQINMGYTQMKYLFFPQKRVTNTKEFSPTASNLIGKKNNCK